MNVLRLKEFCSEPNNTYTGSWSKLITRLKTGSVCSYSNHLASRPVGQSMQRSLKLKLQNAITQAFGDTGSPAIFVGGRRRNRKKRKSKNGQIKKKTKKSDIIDKPLSSRTPVTNYYEDVANHYDQPKVSCLDVKEPVFADHPIKSRLKDADRDSMYNSSDSLSSYSSERSVFNEKVSRIQKYLTDTNGLIANDAKQIGIPRLHSHDSGVYDDEDDGGFCDELTTDYDELNSGRLSAQTDSSEQSVDDNDLGDAEAFSLAIVNDLELDDVTEETCDIEGVVTETCLSSEVIDEFDTVVLGEIEAEITHENSSGDLGDTDAAVLQINEAESTNDVFVKELQGLEEADPFLKFVNNAEDDEEIVFDLSQLEVNSLDEISKTKETNAFQQQQEDQEVPTVLEDEIPLTIPLDLLIDEDDDEVLFEAGNRKELSITCNPLYEYTVKEEEDRLSIKSYQSGFTTNFDNVSQIPVPASDKAAQKSLRESTPLIKRQPILGDRDDELACCVIL